MADGGQTVTGFESHSEGVILGWFCRDLGTPVQATSSGLEAIREGEWCPFLWLFFGGRAFFMSFMILFQAT